MALGFSRAALRPFLRRGLELPKGRRHVAATAALVDAAPNPFWMAPMASGESAGDVALFDHAGGSPSCEVFLPPILRLPLGPDVGIESPQHGSFGMPGPEREAILLPGLGFDLGLPSPGIIAPAVAPGAAEQGPMAAPGAAKAGDAAICGLPAPGEVANMELPSANPAAAPMECLTYRKAGRKKSQGLEEKWWQEYDPQKANYISAFGRGPFGGNSIAKVDWPQQMLPIKFRKKWEKREKLRFAYRKNGFELDVPKWGG